MSAVMRHRQRSRPRSRLQATVALEKARRFRLRKPSEVFSGAEDPSQRFGLKGGRGKGVKKRYFRPPPFPLKRGGVKLKCVWHFATPHERQFDPRPQPATCMKTGLPHRSGQLTWGQNDGIPPQIWTSDERTAHIPPSNTPTANLMNTPTCTISSELKGRRDATIRVNRV
eukprot:358996-Chlamydomonas_euryale.AAC.3